MPLLLLATFLAASMVSTAHAARIGLFMGTFDPPHLGIARMIDEARARLQLETIFVLPTPTAVDRPTVTPIHHRLTMLRLMAQAVVGMETLTESDMTAIVSRNPTNMFAALREDLLSRRPPGDEIYQIVGEDAMPKLLARHQLPRTDEPRTLVVFPRVGVAETRAPEIAALEKTGRLVRLRVPIPDLSSREIRAALGRQVAPTAAQLPDTVRQYIVREGLYGLPPAPITREVIAQFCPAGYLAKPVLLHSPTTDSVFVPAHIESVVADDCPDSATVPAGSDLPTALADLLQQVRVQVVVFQAPTTDALDWLETQGWRALHGWVPPHGEDWPMLFLARRGPDWHLFVTGLFNRPRFARLAGDLRALFERSGIPSSRLTLMVPINPGARSRD